MFRKKIRNAVVLSTVLLSAGLSMGVFGEELELIEDEDTQVVVSDDSAVTVLDDDEEEDDFDDGAEFIEDWEEEVALSDGALYTDIIAEENRQEAIRLQARELLSNGLSIPAVSEESLKTYLGGLMSEVSPTGSNGELMIASYIESVMKDLGYTIYEQNFHEGFLNENYTDVPGMNIIAERGTNSYTSTNGILVVACHYDSKTDPEEGDRMANDKSGAAVVLETARILSSVTSDVDICFVFLSGEEDGLYGSYQFVSSLSEEQKQRILGVIYAGPLGSDKGETYLLGTEAGELNTPARVMREIAAQWELKEMMKKLGMQTSIVDGEMAVSSDNTMQAETEGTDADVKNGEIWGLVDTSDAATEAVKAENIAQTESATEAGAEDDSKEMPPEEWDLVKESFTGRKMFEAAGLQSVTLFQDVLNLYSPETDAEDVTESQRETQAVSTEAAPSEPETDEMPAATLYLAEEEVQDAQIAELSKAADILAGTIAQYMKRASY